MSKTSKGVWAVIIIGGIVAGLVAMNQHASTTIVEVEKPTLEEVESEREKKLNEIRNRENMKKLQDLNVEEVYQQEVIKDANERIEEAETELQRIRSEKMQIEEVAVQALSSYLAKKNPDLVKYASEIVKLERWPDVVAIAFQETTLCQNGVGSSRNNCGAIKNGKTGQFKVYATPMDSLWDIAYLLQEPHFRGKSISQMNGTYCVDESEAGNKCRNWTENIQKEVRTLLSYAK